MIVRIGWAVFVAVAWLLRMPFVLVFYVLYGLGVAAMFVAELLLLLVLVIADPAAIRSLHRDRR